MLMPALLTVLLLLATREDIRSRRIPNGLILAGIVLGIGLNGLLPQGLGWLAAVKGLGLGFVLLLPLYLLRAMGAGDVKLMAMAGAFLGPADVAGAVVATLLAGGVMALAVALWAGRLLAMLGNVKYMLLGSLLNMHAGQPPVMNDLPGSVARLPYAVAITAGTLAYLMWRGMT